MSKRMSPGAQLLRSSRLFSIPPPLPRPRTETAASSGRRVFRDSDTATTPYPIHQAIATTESSLGRGDWGLKRALPIRQTVRASKPALRLTNLDTIEHVTDYESATDHSYTLEKFQELGIAMVRQVASSRWHDIRRSAFDEIHDITAVAPVSQEQRGHRRNTKGDPPARWKHRGQSLDHMSEGEFEWYLEKRVRGRAKEFGAFLEDRLRTRRLKEIASKMRSQEQNYWKQEYYLWLSGLSRGQFQQYKQAGLRRNMEFKAYVQDKLQSETNITSDLKPIERQPPQVTLQPRSEAVDTVNAESLQKQQDYSQSEILQVPHPSMKVGTQTSIIAVESSRIEQAVETAASVEKTEREQLQGWDASFSIYVQDSIRLLRHDTRLMSELNGLINEFLDIPALSESWLPNDQTRAFIERALPDRKRTNHLTTHPSAGISYLRSGAFLENHPLLGPRAHKTPHQARVLVARNQGPNSMRAVLGVAGFAVGESGSGGEAGKFNVSNPGGSKVWVEAVEATVDTQGYIRLNIRPALPQDVDVRNRKAFLGTPPAVSDLTPSPRIEPLLIEHGLSAGPFEGSHSGPPKSPSATLLELQNIYQKQQALASAKTSARPPTVSMRS